MNILIRPARPDEADQVFAIHKNSAVAGFATVFPQDRYPFPDLDVRRRWRVALADPAVEVVMAEVAGRAVGVAATRPDWLEGLYVVPEVWGRGVGGRLDDYAVARLRELGCERCHLWVLERNQRARRFYEERGWQLNGETRVVPFPPNPIDVGYTLLLGKGERQIVEEGPATADEPATSRRRG